jgi:hypothetical protein
MSDEAIEVILGKSLHFIGDVVPDEGVVQGNLPKPVIIASDWLPQETTGVVPAKKLHDEWWVYPGVHQVVGTVTENGSPANKPLSRRVLLIDELTGDPIREVWSRAADGEYTFDKIDGTRKYTVVSYDYTGYHRAVIANNLTPEPMP